MAEQTGKKRSQPPSLGLSPLSRVRLDELLQEMLDRVGDVVASRERLRALLDAVVGVVNMGERAGDLGGTFEIGPGAAGGTLVMWRVPLG